MKKKWIKFLKDYEDNKKDAIVQVDETIADSLVNLKIAEEAPSPESEIADEAIKEFAGSVKELVTAGVADVVKEFTKEIKTKIPAVPKDHEEEGRRGFKNSSDFFNAIIRSNPHTGRVDKRLQYETIEGETKAPSGLNTQDDSSAGYLVPETFSSEIWELIVAQNEIFSQTDKYTTSSNNLNINGVEESSRKDGYRDGGMLAYWIEEAATYTSSAPRFKRIRMELHKLGVLSYMTEEQIAYGSTNLGPLLSRKAAKAINFKVNEAFIWGTGVGKPLGAMMSDALISVPIEVNQGNDSILHHNINRMYHAMHPDLRGTAKWYVHPNLAEQLEYIAFNDVLALGTGTVQVPIYMPPGGLTNAPYGTLRGRPVIPCEFMHDLGQKGDILFANFGQYASLTKEGGGIKSAVSMHVRFLFDEQAFKWTFSIDGQSLWSSPLEDYNGTTKRSPFVTLKSRDTVSSSSGL